MYGFIVLSLGIGRLAKLPDTGDDKPDSDEVVLEYERMDIIQNSKVVLLWPR